MAGSGGLGLGLGLALEPANSAEVLPWLKNLPVAPEYHPTLAEFQDPIAYIFKIEKEASMFGICKIVPPVLQSSKKTVISNFNRSLRSSDEPPTFTTRQQQIGFCPRRPRPVQKSFWESGETYTFHEFEAKAKLFEKSYLKKHSKKGFEKASSFSPLEIETLYWKATVDKPFSVEYANDMPGSAFSQKKAGGGNVVGEGVTVGDTEWNMRGVSRAKGSLLRFMKEEIPGVTSPMVYVAMMFSWFAWHVEDHDLHSLNYLHTGAGKTWYGVPKEAAVAFEEVVRVHGYGGEINPLVTFSVLGEKTTVMSPEVIVSAGVPCCRLVQNPGEFVVTFPRAYHSGFSHGFNCGEAANIATPEWLRVAKDAAVRRASINYSPMVSHLQLLYDLALELCTRIPMSINSKPRSSRLRNKQKGEGEALVKEFFVKNILQNDHLLHILGKESPIVLLPQSSLHVTICSNLRVGSQLRANRSFGLCGHKGLMRFSKSSVSDDFILDRNHGLDQVKGYYSSSGNFGTLYEKNMVAPSSREESATELVDALNGDKLPNQRLFSCVKCGIMCFDCVAVVQPTEAAATHLMSADCSFLNEWIAGSRVTSDRFAVAGGDASTDEHILSTRWAGKQSANSVYDVPVHSVKYQTQMAAQSSEMASETGRDGRTSALGLLAITYGNSSDSEEDHIEADVSSHVDENGMTNCLSRESPQNQDSAGASLKRECHEVLTAGNTQCSSMVCSDDIALCQTNEQYLQHGRHGSPLVKDRSDQSPDFFIGSETNDLTSNGTIFSRAIIPAESSSMSFQRSDEDSSRMHVFCLEHAMEVEQQLRPIGGVHILLFCHPEYPRIVAEAKMVSGELGTDHHWNNLSFREATTEDGEKIQLALDSEDAIPRNADWAVKLGINLFYSANLSWSPLYSKQMPYNTVIYDAFGRSSPSSSPSKSTVCERRSGRQKKVVAGKWCGKVWMSNQVHPFLVKWDSEEKDSEQEQERSYRRGATPEIKPQSDHKTEANVVTRKYQRKRKMLAEGRSVKKAKNLEAQYSASCHSAEDNYYKQYSRTCNRKQTKFIGRRILYNLLEDNYLKQSRRIPENKQFKSIEREDIVSDDSLEDKTHQQVRRILGSNPASYIESGNMLAFDALERNYQKRHRKFPRCKQVKFVDKEGAVSDDSLEDINVFAHGRARRRQEFLAREDTFSDDSFEESPSPLHGRLLRIKQAKYVDDIVSDDSVEDASYHRISGGKETKYVDSEDADSDDSLEEYYHQQRTIFPRKKQGKTHDKEDECSNYLLRDHAYQQQRTKRSKHFKFFEIEETTSEDSIDEFIQQQLSRNCKRKQAKYVENDVSDDLPGNPAHQHRQMSRTTKVNSIKNEEHSDHPQDDHTYPQGRKTPRNRKSTSFNAENVLDDVPLTMHRKLRNSSMGKLAKFIMREEAASDDSLEDDSNQPCSTVVRSRQNKSTTLPKVKQSSSRQAKKGTAKLIKETPLVVKSERQVKQGSPRLRNRKSEQNAKQFDSHAEEELEGGPSTRLRRRPSRAPNQLETKRKEKQKVSGKEAKTSSDLKASVGQKNRSIKDEDAGYQCDMEGCTMSFCSKQELSLHKRNICPVKGCGKTFFSHKYLVQHRRVHMDDRPLKCPWKGCKMTFKWAWARTEHIRVHTGARPYVCAEEGCGQTFRFVSDFSRHKRKTGHSAKKTGSNSRKIVT